MIKNYLVIGFILLLILPVNGQSSSVYSRFGLGDIEYSYSARRAGMGQLGVSVADDMFINTLNPAGWNQIQRTRIEFGLYYNGMFLSDDNNSGFYSETEFSGFTMAFPISELYGITMAAGIVPYSNVSYEIKETFTAPEHYEAAYTGSGGLSKMFIGTSYRLPFGLAMGASADYYFGNLIYKSKIDFISSSTAFAEYQKRYNPKGLGLTFGFISPDISSIIDTITISELKFGASVSYMGTLETNNLITSRSSSGIDTLNFDKGNIDIPISLNAGVNIVVNKKYLISLDYYYQPWSELKFNDIVLPGIRNAQMYSLGFEYKPAPELGSTFWEQIIWRTGLSFEETQYLINDQGIDRYTFSGGFSLPISVGNTLDIGIQYSIRGTKEFILVKENIIRLNLGISFGELWFIRQSY